MNQDRTLPLSNQPIYYINQFALGSTRQSLAEIIADLAEYTDEEYLHIFEDGPDGTRIVYLGRASKIVSEYQFEQDYMDMATANLGNR
jgi:hypothetical protein